MPGFDLKQINRNDRAILGAGIVAFIASFLPFYGISYSLGVFGGGSYTWSAWHSYATLGVLLILIGAGIVAARVFANANLPRLPLGVNALVAGVSALGTLLLILRWLTWPHVSGNGVSVGLKYGGWILVLAGIVQTVFAVMSFMASGEKLAWDSTALNRPPAQPTAPASEQPSEFPPTDQGTLSN